MCVSEHEVSLARYVPGRIAVFSITSFVILLNLSIFSRDWLSQYSAEKWANKLCFRVYGFIIKGGAAVPRCRTPREPIPPFNGSVRTENCRIKLLLSLKKAFSSAEHQSQCRTEVSKCFARLL